MQRCMRRKLKTIAVSEETYAAVLEFKERTGCRTMDEAVRRMLELSRLALAAEVLEHVRRRRLTEEDRELLRELRRRLREEGVWLRRS